MHRQVASLLSTRSPGRLAKLGNALGKEGIDIATTGGAEWLHSGPITLMIKDDWGGDDDNQIQSFAAVMAREEFPWLVFRTIEVEMKDEPGALGAAATVLDDINIYAVTILESHGSKARVGLGIRPKEVGEAIRRLRRAKYVVDRRHHPRDPDMANQAAEEDWMDAWDARTERLLDWYEEHPDTPPNDPVFYELG